jgi:hypothetical protein
MVPLHDQVTLFRARSAPGPSAIDWGKSIGAELVSRLVRDLQSLCHFDGMIALEIHDG